MQTFCPHCANSLTIAKSAPDDNHPTGLNRLTCRTCPYAFPIDARYFERKYMKRKEVDDVLEEGDGKGMDIAEVQCTREGCDNAQASFYQVQIRSADEPMTTFYKVRASYPTSDGWVSERRWLTLFSDGSVQVVDSGGKKTEQGVPVDDLEDQSR